MRVRIRVGDNSLGRENLYLASILVQVTPRHGQC